MKALVYACAKKNWSHGLSQGVCNFYLDLQGSAITSEQFRLPDRATFAGKPAPGAAHCSQAGALQAQDRGEWCPRWGDLQPFPDHSRVRQDPAD